MTTVAISAHGATTTTVGTLDPACPVEPLAPLTMSPPQRPMNSTASQMLVIASPAHGASCPYLSFMSQAPPEVGVGVAGRSDRGRVQRRGDAPREHDEGAVGGVHHGGREAPRERAAQ